MTENRSPLERALDLLVYAPLGVALTARDELPKLVERGRQEVRNRVTTARMMGEYAVDQGQKKATRLVDQAQEALDRGRSHAPWSTIAAAPGGSGDPAATTGPAPSSAPSTNGQVSRDASRRPESPRPSAAGLAIPGYDALSASQVVTRLAGLLPPELEAVRGYEEATRHRKTILSRVAQLQADQPG